MAIKVIRKSTGEVGYGDEYPCSTDKEPLNWLVKFPNQSQFTFPDGAPDFEITYFDEVNLLEEVNHLNERCTFKTNQDIITGHIAITVLPQENGRYLCHISPNLTDTNKASKTVYGQTKEHAIAIALLASSRAVSHYC